MTLRRLLALPLALITACSADPPALPPSAGGEAGSQVTPSLDATTLRATMVPGTSAFIERKPCALLAPEELTELELEPPGTPEKSSTGWACKWNGKQFSMIITIEGTTTLAQIEASRPGKRISIAGRAAWMAQGDGQFAGLCDLALDVTRIASVDIVLSHYDRDSGVACLNAVKVAALVDRRLPGA